MINGFIIDLFVDDLRYYDNANINLVINNINYCEINNNHYNVGIYKLSTKVRNTNCSDK